MRLVVMVLYSIMLVCFLAACSDSAKVEDLTKANAALTAELKECRASQKKEALKEEDTRRTKEALERMTKEPMNKTKF